MENEDWDSYLQITELIKRKLDNDLSPQEDLILNSWLEADPDNRVLMNRLMDEQLRSADLTLMSAFDTVPALDKLNSRIEQEQLRRSRRRRWMAFTYKAVAAAILIFVVTLVFYPGKKDLQQPPVVSAAKETVRDSNQISLTLSGGTTIALETAGTGVIGEQDGAVITKSADGVLQYKAASGNTSPQIAWNTLYIPKGKQYQIVLPDGSKVWLNAHTTLKYPAAFNAAERLVELNGEAYFEVASRAGQPFKVQAKDQLIQVLGTEFNVSAYAQEDATATTLVAGAVRVSNEATSVVIKPGQKAAVNLPGGKITVADADMDGVLAWKNGFLNFSDDKIEDIMRQVERAYNVEVEYKDNVKGRRFWGRFPIHKGLPNLLTNLEQTNTIHFKLEGKKILVME